MTPVAKEPTELYAMSAVLMDGDSGRVLYEKDGNLPLANASTTFVVSLLGCGWPDHKNYKWSDTKKLLSYGDYNYNYETYWQEPQTEKILVTDGAEDDRNIGTLIYLRGKCSVTPDDRNKKILLKEGETVTCQTEIPKEISAPVLKGEISLK